MFAWKRSLYFRRDIDTRDATSCVQKHPLHEKCSYYSQLYIHHQNIILRQIACYDFVEKKYDNIVEGSAHSALFMEMSTHVTTPSK